MSNASRQIVNKARNFAHALRNAGLSCMAITERVLSLISICRGAPADHSA